MSNLSSWYFLFPFLQRHTGLLIFFQAGIFLFQWRKLKIPGDIFFPWFYFAKVWDLEWILRESEWEEGQQKKKMDILSRREWRWILMVPPLVRICSPLPGNVLENDNLILRKERESASRKALLQTLIRAPMLGRPIYFLEMKQMSTMKLLAVMMTYKS